jgi:hypothetical protein
MGGGLISYGDALKAFRRGVHQFPSVWKAVVVCNQTSRLRDAGSRAASLAVAAAFVGELLFGGARGGGKSDYLLGDFLQDIEQGEKWRGIIFRKSYPS